MQTFFQFHSKLEPFRLFSREHLITIAIILVLGILLFIFREEIQKQEKRRIIRLSLALLLLASDASYHIWLVSKNTWSFKKALPLHLSDLAVILAIVMLLTGSFRLFQFMYFAGLGSSIQAVLTPDLGRYSFPHFRYIEFFVSHGGVVLACLFMVFAFKYRPTIRSMWMTVLLVNLYAICIFFLNKWLGANYLYIMKKPGNASLLDVLGPWPWYLISLEIIMIVTFYLLYSPFWLKREMDRK
ncbi:TIGR02206 family membrane protein [Metabacillus sediminilitoris]|uniref:TIGR02206 family membrane protein n=1 Tax=Metabacillus sediminilitoris TaxID=2567941 RepID=A0A4S4BTZ3_9BACI|nr:TIGR02206 family membrane protein [Metabacillus sediminilitoris]QGQ44939.1 TIGR02206 family membrane protein [Metabacillus sediminilitoris]THF78572.1 TIGR02206 family membrane protein [Metabacillus sediminilitoris]